jgi:hypothetical protein
MAYTRQELSKQAKVSITEARAKGHRGKITDEELEKEKVGPAFAIRSTLSAAR